MKIVSNNFYDETSNTIRIYERGKSAGSWEMNIDWNRLETENMPNELKTSSLRVATSSSHVEQIGMANAALLLCRCDDFNLKLGLAQAVMDEARHAEIFLRYAQAINGPVPAIGSAADELTDHFNSLDNFDLIFLSHVYLENLALEQFQLFIESFKGYLISDLYKGALTDEARHVSLGMSYLKDRVINGKLTKKSIKNHIDKYNDLLGVSDEGCDWISNLTKISSGEIKDRMLTREYKFVSRILGSD